jgi:predicted ATP-dependent endonuclease of OLD family
LVAKVARLSNPDYVHATEYEELCKAVLGFRISVHAAEDGVGQQAGIPVGSFGYIPIESMGEGVSSQLGLITDLCMANGNLFLIEEPENDIHPEGLKTLLNVIVEKSKTNQFIVSTHSNIVTRYLGAAPDSKIFEFESAYKPNEIPTSAIREVETTPEARIAVLRHLGYELSDFDLWDGWLILEESSAEIIIRYLIPWFVPGLARIRTVAAGGTSKVEPTFEDFRRLFLFTHLEPQYRGKAWVVADGDREGKKVVAELQAKYKDWPPDHFITWSQAYFEHYYPSRFEEQVKDVLSKSHGEKRAAKKSLLDQVKAWCDENPEEARAEFETSAADVIEVLRGIERDLLT